MASARTDNGMPEYDGTRFRLMPHFSGWPQDPYCHEVPLYMEFNEEKGWLVTIHGPQEPRDIAREAGTRLPTRGPNPITGSVRLPFGLRDDGYEYALGVPRVHHAHFEWLIPNETINGGPMIACMEGGVSIFQVAAKRVWYIGTWMAKEQQGYGLDPTALKRYRPNSLELKGKIIFARRTLVLPGGEVYETGEITSTIAGGPSVIEVKHIGHPDYPRFPNVKMTISSAKFNNTRYRALLGACLNRQGFLCSHNRHLEIMGAVTHPGEYPDILYDRQAWDIYGVGDDLQPHADVLAPIQPQHKGPTAPESGQ